MKKSLLVLSVVASAAMANTYTLGQVNVQAKTVDDINMIEKTITSEAITRDNSITVSDALDNISGVNQDMQGGRGEGTLYIRGFDAKRIGVYIDGIPISVPYDGNFDYNRFLTSDVGQIDISKGFSAVAYGGNTMGGVVNIVSKKPTKELEGNIKGTIILDSNAKLARHIESLNVGTMLDGFYAQLGATYSKQDHFRMSDDFVPANNDQPKGDRLKSKSEDKKVSLKFGYVADDKSEIAISYANQKGKKQQPPVTDSDFARTKYWDWPKWDKETISIAGQKNFGNSYIKALAYYDKSENTLYSYDDSTYTTYNSKGFRSPLEDYTYGSRLEYGLETGDNFLKLSANYKKDSHRKFNLDSATDAKELDEAMKQHTISVGVDNSYKITKELELIAGISYDRFKGDSVYKPGAYQGLDTISAYNPQAALIYAVDDNSKVKASASQKTYLPNMKDRYSGGLGTKVANPDLDKETATHLELGYAYQTQALLAGVNLYYTKVKDKIQGVATSETYVNKGKTYYKDQNQNIGTFDHRGIELDLEYIHEQTQVGGNYSYINLKNKKENNEKIVDVPKHQVFAFAKQEIGAGFSLYGNMKIRKGAYENKMDGTYVINPTFTTYDFKVIYTPMKELTAEVGVKNLTDKLYSYDMAYPMAGREFFASLDYKF
jgi:iron complex outermembrane receptor protein